MIIYNLFISIDNLLGDLVLMRRYFKHFEHSFWIIVDIKKSASNLILEVILEWPKQIEIRTTKAVIIVNVDSVLFVVMPLLIDIMGLEVFLYLFRKLSVSFSDFLDSYSFLSIKGVEVSNQYHMPVNFWEPIVDNKDGVEIIPKIIGIVDENL